MYVYSAQGGVVGVSAEPDRIGELLWDVARKGNVVAPSAVQVFLSHISHAQVTLHNVDYGR